MRKSLTQNIALMLNIDKIKLEANLNKSDSGIDIDALKAFNGSNSFLFNQTNFIRYGRRSTFNLGIGYRRLNLDETWMTGINAFYDHEFPNDHKRNGGGFEFITSVCGKG